MEEKRFFEIGFNLLYKLVNEQARVRINDDLIFAFLKTEDNALNTNFWVIEENPKTGRQHWIFDSLEYYLYVKNTNFSFPVYSEDLNSIFLKDLVREDSVVRIKLTTDPPFDYWLTKLTPEPIIENRKYGSRRELGCYGAVCCSGHNDNILYVSENNEEHTLTELEYLSVLDLPNEIEENTYNKQLKSPRWSEKL